MPPKFFILYQGITIDDLDKQRKEMAKICHPDKHPDPDEAEKYKIRFQEMMQEYETLKELITNPPAPPPPLSNFLNNPLVKIAANFAIDFAKPAIIEHLHNATGSVKKKIPKEKHGDVEMLSGMLENFIKNTKI